MRGTRRARRLEEGEEIRSLLSRLAETLAAKRPAPREGLVLRPGGRTGWKIAV